MVGVAKGGPKPAANDASSNGDAQKTA
jgi:hypothetical protein